MERKHIFHFNSEPHGPHVVVEGGDAARVLWEVTEHGTVGQEFVWYEPDGSAQSYLVIHKAEHGGEVHVTCLPSIAEPMEVPQIVECENCGSQAVVHSSSAIYDVPKRGKERQRQVRLSINCPNCGTRSQVLSAN
jgi:endogenous inhibitor of DNA gyrase (YacG/DUF329 family)